MKILVVILLIGISGFSIKSQNSQNAEDNYKKQKEDEWVKKNKQAGQPGATNLPSNTNNNNNSQLPSEKPTSVQLKTIDLKIAEETEKQRDEALKQINEQFAISAERLNKHSVFLKQKNTGIAKMFPDANCSGGATVSVAELERCGKFPLVKGNGARYSIKLSKIPSYLWLESIYELFELSEMFYQNDALLFGNKSNQAMVCEIGDVGLDSVDSKFPVTKFLNDYKMDRKKSGFVEQRKILEKGITHHGYFYSNKAPIKLNSTYIFRSVAFLPERPQADSINFYNFWFVDMTVAFKIVEKADDGSIIFIWKKLREKEAVYLQDK